MDYLKNTSYIFIPIKFDKIIDFKPVIDKLNSSQIWTPVQMDIKYMLKYVADKLNNKEKKACQCFHYEVNENIREKMGLATKSEWYTTGEYPYKDTVEKFRFQILNVQLYCFSTSVCIMAFKIHLEKDDPLWVSTAQYYLKKVSREKIKLDKNEAIDFTFLEMSEKLVAECASVTALNFFYYANPTTERSNVFTYLEVDQRNSYKYELFYLRRCYSERYIFAKNYKLDSEEIYIPSNDIVWGISPEAAVCLACPKKGHQEFIQNTFYNNFNVQYLFMYIILLHQKYVLYMFLTKIGIGTYNDLEMLEEYRRQLYEFETDFVFSCVTEVPQYQNLYERMTTAFSLKKMYEDVHEPLISLSEMRHVTLENQRKKRDKNINNSLLLLSILSIFSAFTDSFDFVNSFLGLFFCDTVIKVVQILCIIIIVILSVFVMINFHKSNKN